MAKVLSIINMKRAHAGEALSVLGDGTPPALRPASACFAARDGNGGGMGGGLTGDKSGEIWNPETVALKDLNLNERWLQSRIKANPEILGIGDVFVRDHERVLPGGGRLDLLLESGNHGKRYEVEIQLGATDPSHIVRVIEYWDLERQLWPEYAHCGVIIAEEITDRFFNVISLLNRGGRMPIMALKLTAIRSPNNPGNAGLLFTKILGEPVPFDDAELAPEVDRAHWIREAGNEWMSLVDKFHENTNLPKNEFPLHYTKSYVSILVNGISVVFFYQRQKGVRVDVKSSSAPNLKEALKKGGVDFNSTSGGKYIGVIVLPSNVGKLADIVGKLLKAANSDA